MVKEVMDTFVPQTWDAKATGREHAQRSADDFLLMALVKQWLNVFLLNMLLVTLLL
mgnify:CR=1 FL=1